MCRPLQDGHTPCRRGDPLREGHPQPEIPEIYTGDGDDISPPLAWEGGPAGTLEDTNDWKRIGYGSPAPPVGVHRYFFKLFALDVVLPDLKHPTKAALEKALEGHVLAKAEVIGRYGRTP